MIDIKYLVGDATNPPTPGFNIIAHVCNDAGLWGSGFVLSISRKWGDPEQYYRRAFDKRGHNDFGLGALQLVRIHKYLYVANMIAQHGIKTFKNPHPIDYAALNICLERLSADAIQLNASVHMPRIGCDRGGGQWDIVGPLIKKSLCRRNIAVYVYDLK